jgi:hypothetical protein
MSEDTMMSRIFGFKKEEVTGRLRNLHNEELYNFSSSNVISVVK